MESVNEIVARLQGTYITNVPALEYINQERYRNPADVEEPPVEALAISTGALSAVVEDQPYPTVNFAATGGLSPYTWSVSSGALPAGLSLSASGALAGTPANPGTSSFTIRVEDVAGTAITKVFSLVVNSASNPPADTGILSLTMSDEILLDNYKRLHGLAPYNTSEHAAKVATAKAQWERQKGQASLGAPLYNVVISTSGVRKTPGPSMAPTGDPKDYISYPLYWWPQIGNLYDSDTKKWVANQAYLTSGGAWTKANDSKYGAPNYSAAAGTQYALVMNTSGLADVNDPSNRNGWPFVQRDGKVNPVHSKINSGRDSNLGTMSDNVRRCAIHYFFTNDEAYAKKAADHARTWFLDKEKGMNPNFNYAQIRLGRNGNRGNAEGTIDAEGTPRAFDGINLIRKSIHWTDADDIAMTDWMNRWITWWETSTIGKSALALRNNIRISAELQIMCCYLYTNQHQKAYNRITSIIGSLFNNMIDDDGLMPLEVARSNSWGYSIKCIILLFELAELCEKIKTPTGQHFDLWNYTINGKGLKLVIKKHYTYCVNKITILDPGGPTWPGQFVSSKDTQFLDKCFMIASEVYKSDSSFDPWWPNYFNKRRDPNATSGPTRHQEYKQGLIVEKHEREAAQEPLIVRYRWKDMP